MDNPSLYERFEFRTIRSEEAPEAAEIEQICFPPNEACSREMMLRRAALASDLFLVAVDRESGRLAGFLNGLATREATFRDEFFTDAGLHDPEGDTVMLCGLDVLPEYRGQGLARELVSVYRCRERERGRKRLVLTCHDSKLDMYRKMGFLDLGISASVWGGETWHDMECSLLSEAPDLPGDRDGVGSSEDAATHADAGTSRPGNRAASPQRVIVDHGIHLNAKLDMPAAAKARCPLVIILHGFTGHMEERHITAISEMLNGIGCATLRVDMYGHGQSEGSFRSHTLQKWLSNAAAVIEYARSLDFVSDLYLCGHSQGGLTVMLAAAQEPEVIKGIIPMSPAVMIPEGARRGLLLGTAFDPERIPEEIRSEAGWVLNGDYIRAAQTIRTEEAIQQYTGPVLLVHGAEDETVPAECSIAAQKAYADAELVIIPGDTHCYDRHLDTAVDAVRQWMTRRI